MLLSLKLRLTSYLRLTRVKSRDASASKNGEWGPLSIYYLNKSKIHNSCCLVQKEKTRRGKCPCLLLIQKQIVDSSINLKQLTELRDIFKLCVHLLFSHTFLKIHITQSPLQLFVKSGHVCIILPSTQLLVRWL